MKLSKRALAIASSLALVSSVAVAAFESSAGAAVAKHDASNDAVTCGDFVGKIAFSTALHLGGSTPDTATITVKSQDCTDTTAGIYNKTTNPTGVSLKSASFKSVLSEPTNDCLSLQGLSAASGAMTGTWAVNPGTPALLNSKSTLNVSQIWGGQFNDGGSTSPAADSDSWGSEYGFFSMGAAGSGNTLGSGQSNTAQPTATGSFTGGDSGHKSFFTATSSASSGELATLCFSAAGIKSLAFGIGGITLK